MKKLCAVTLVSVFLFACSKGDEGNQTAPAQAYPGTFTGTLTGQDFSKEYKVAVRCSGFDTDDFEFNSDRLTTVDSNGDGIIISGMAFKDKFIFSIKDQGKEFSTGRLANVSKGDNGMEGSGSLWQDNARGASFDVRFSMTCN